MAEQKMRMCRHCYNLFEITLNHELQMYCCHECYNAERQKRAREKYAENQKKKIEETNNFLKKCELCGKEFHANKKSYGKTKFCSVECRNNYYKTDEYKNKLALKQGRPIFRAAKVNLDLVAISIKAKEEGISYGECVRKYNL